MPDTDQRRSRLTLALRVGAIIALVAVVVASAILLPDDFFPKMLEWVKELGIWGPIALALLYVVAAVFLVPGTILTLGAGFAFGLVPGIIAVSIGSTAGAAAAFLVGRTLARRWVEQRVVKYPKFAAIDRAVAAHGFKIVLLTRLSPVFPFNVSNYIFGLTRISFGSYVLASWIGMMPATILFVYLGHATGSIAQLRRQQSAESTPRLALLVVGLIATILVTVLVTRIAKRALDQAVAESSSRETSWHPN